MAQTTQTAQPIQTAQTMQVAATASAAPEQAANAAGPDVDSPADATLDSVIVTGTRASNVKARDSAAPIAVISGEALQATGATDLRDALERTLPSLNVQSFSGDLGALTDAIQLRGLSPDDVLVLVNGKRRHTTANIYLDAGPQQGSAPVDLDLIPLSAIDHIEVLEDGAAAQYGSDAIAGVINIILKSGDHGGNVEATTGQYYHGDGFTAGGAGDIGTSLGEDGFLHLSIDYRHHDHSVRSGPDSRTGEDDNDIFGDPESTRTAFGYNAGKSFADGGVELYSFGTYANRYAESFENYRLPSILPEVFPDGFSPEETIEENDFSATLGIKGNDLWGWHWDLSSTYGGDDDRFGLIHSANPGLYVVTGATPTSFHISTNKDTQWTNNLDFVRPFDVGLASPISTAFGFEYRRETYSLSPGDPASYLYGGSQSYVALEPVSAGNHQRSNYAGYVDISGDPVADWVVDLAGRYEHYTDFGDATSGKLSMRYNFIPRFALRGTVSNGFRAPSLAQEYFSNLNVSPTGASGQLAVNSPAALALGAVPLQAEKSTNFSVGAVAEPLEGLQATLDAYYIKIKNRIIEGGTYEGPIAVAALESQGVTFPPGIDPADVSAVYFSNGADTKTYGADFTLGYRSDLGGVGTVDWDAEANWTHTEVTRIGLDNNGNPLLNAQGVAYLTSAQPQSKIILGGTWRNSGWVATLHEIRYGQSIFQDTFFAGPDIFSNKVFYESIDPPRYVTNLEFGYRWAVGLEWVAGAANLFNVYPKELPPAERYLGAARFDGNTGIGIDGGYYYTRVSFGF
jgi:iron complex outermembrane recepter protein